MLKFPYGISDFAKLITNHYFYVDRTHLLPAIEARVGWTSRLHSPTNQIIHCHY